MIPVIRDTWRTFARHDGVLLGGATAFFALLSAAPLLIIVMALAAPLTGTETARAELMRGMVVYVGPDGARTVGALLDSARMSGSGTLPWILSVLLILYGSSRLFVQVYRALNHMWGVHALEGRDLKAKTERQLRKRLLAFAMVPVCAASLLGAVLLRAGLTVAAAASGSSVGGWPYVDFVLSLVVVTLLFTLLFKVLPDVKLSWRDAAVGGLVTSVLFTAGKVIVGWYLGRKSLGSAFGAAGSVVMLLLWTYYTAQIFYLGAAFTAVYARRQGRPLEPTSLAAPISMPED